MKVFSSVQDQPESNDPINEPKLDQEKDRDCLKSTDTLFYDCKSYVETDL